MITNHVVPTPLSVTPKPLPPAAQPTLRAEHLVGKPLVSVTYSKLGERIGYVQPIWTREVTDYYRNASVDDFNAAYGGAAYKAGTVWLIEGTRDDAYRAAAERALMSHKHAQANAVFDAGRGQFLVASLGGWRDTTFNFMAIDDSGSGSFAQLFGDITKVEAKHPNLIALVGARSVVELKPDATPVGGSQPTEALVYPDVAMGRFS